MISNPLISVIIPNYNCLPYLPACFNCIDQQEVPALEIIVVDDGSTDGSVEWLMEQQQERENLIVLKEKGQGPGGARNVAAQVAKGQFLAFLDADDLWAPNKLIAQVEFMKQHENVVLSFTDYHHINELDGSEIIGCFEYWPKFSKIAKQVKNVQNYNILNDSTSTLFAENIVGTSTVMCRKDAYLAVNGFDVTLPSASDWDLWLKLTDLGDVAFTNSKQMGYLMRQGSVSSNIINRIAAIHTISERHISKATKEDPRSSNYIQARLADAYHDYFIKENKLGTALKYSFLKFYKLPSLQSLKQIAKDTVSLL